MKNRYSIYSENDPISSIENLAKYAEELNSKKVLVQHGGHFGPKSNVTRIKELEEIIVKIRK